MQQEVLDGSRRALMTGYLESLSLVERLHRLLLDVIKDEFERLGVLEINSVQALLLFNIGENEVTAGELKTRGYYQGSNVSYNLKKLVVRGGPPLGAGAPDRKGPPPARHAERPVRPPRRRAGTSRHHRRRRDRRDQHQPQADGAVLDRPDPVYLLGGVGRR
jgi:hypothetical protein